MEKIVRKAIKGLSDIGIFPVLENTEKTYKVGSRIGVKYAQKMTTDDKISYDPIDADDETYDENETYEGTDFEIQIPESDLDQYPHFEGGNYDEAKKEYSWSPDSPKSYHAMTFRARRKDGKYRMFRYYLAKFKKVKQDFTSDGKGSQIATLTISGTFYKRSLIEQYETEDFGTVFVQNVRTVKDTETLEDLEWIKTIPEVKEGE